jgi:hypothetical protein
VERIRIGEMKCSKDYILNIIKKVRDNCHGGTNEFMDGWDSCSNELIDEFKQLFKNDKNCKHDIRYKCMINPKMCIKTKLCEDATKMFKNLNIED